MKKILLFASALAGLFLAGSCQKETLEPAAQGGVTYEISLPDGPQTKGEDGYKTYDLHYEVYKTVNATDLATAPLLFEKTVTMEGNTTTVTLDLLNDQDYTILFWANKQGENYFDLTDLRQVGVRQAASNNDDRDAFCGKDQLVQHDGAQSKTVELKRPFAQINIATLVNNVDYDINPVSSLVKVKNIPVKYNVFTGEPVGDAVEVDYTVNLIPEGNLTVNTTEYKKVAMNYALVPATQDNSATVEVYYEINTANGTVKNSIPNVPVKKNYRTNIIGNLLTSNATYTIELKPGFEEGDLAPHPIYLAAANGGEVTLTEDLDLGGKTLEIKGDMSLNLNGKTVTGVMTVEDGADVTIENGTIKNEDKAVSGITTNGNLTLNDVEIESARHAVRVESGKVVINGGTYTVAPVSNSTLHALNVGDDNTEAEVIIKGGKFIGPKGTMADSGSAVNVRSGSKVTIEGGDFSGGKKKTLACGGTLTVKGGSFDQDPAAFVAEGYKVMAKDGKFYVVSEDTDGIVSDKADLQNALKAAVANGEKDVVIDAEGASLNLDWGFSTSTVPAGTTVTIRNANLEGRSKNNYANGTIIFEDCTFSNPTGAYSIHFDGGKGSLIFKNCDLVGWNSFAGTLESVSFENCTLTGNGIYALIRSYTDLTLKNCTINTSNADHTDVYSEGIEAIEPANLTMENIVYVVYDEKSMQFALENAAVNTIYLNPREEAYVADIYNGTAARESLTIIGYEGAKFGHTATTGGQLRLDLFDRFTISNCEIIQRSGVKTWGHIVFGGSGKENGVYTVENCTFTGVGTQGIYINETASGATYNVTNCTFNGDFGSADGAVTIQNNRGVKFNVNITGCTFNMENGSRAVCYLYDDSAFKLNVDSDVVPVCLYR